MKRKATKPPPEQPPPKRRKIYNGLPVPVKPESNKLNKLLKYEPYVLENILSFLPLQEVEKYQYLGKKYFIRFRKIFCLIVSKGALLQSSKLQRLISKIYSHEESEHECLKCGFEIEPKWRNTHRVLCPGRNCNRMVCPDDRHLCYGGCLPSQNHHRCSHCIKQCEQCFKWFCSKHRVSCRKCVGNRYRCDRCKEICMNWNCNGKIAHNCKRLKKLSVDKKRSPYHHIKEDVALYHHCEKCRKEYADTLHLRRIKRFTKKKKNGSTIIID